MGEVPSSAPEPATAMNSLGQAKRRCQALPTQIMRCRQTKRSRNLLLPQCERGPSRRRKGP